MPRAKVPPGSESKRSSSSASMCRGANFSCCATSASARPREVRACESASPTPQAAASVKVPSLQRLVFGGARELTAQLCGIARFGKALAELALDAQREPERLRARRHELVEAPDEPARLVHAPLAVADHAHLQERGRIVRLELERALEKVLRLLEVVRPQGALARGRIRAPGRRVARVADRLEEVLHRGLLAAGLAQEPAVVVVDVRV